MDYSKILETGVFYLTICGYTKPEYVDNYEYRADPELYPVHLACYNLDINEGLCLQSGIYDAIKFSSLEDAIPFKEKAESCFADHEFEYCLLSKNVYGRDEVIRFVYKG